MPRDAGDSRDGAELVDDVPRNEVNVVVAEFDGGVANSFAAKLIQSRLVDPCDTLHQERIAVREQLMRHFNSTVNSRLLVHYACANLRTEYFTSKLRKK